jgi:hypothetical protein
LDTHPWNWDNFNAKNLWSWQLGNVSLRMCLVHDNEKNLSKITILSTINILFSFISTETQWVFSIFLFLFLSIDIPIFLQGRMFKDGPNWKNTHLHVASFYFSQDILRRKNILKNKFICNL